MFGIDGIIIALLVMAVSFGAISWMLGRAEQRRYEEVMRTGEREAFQASSAQRSDPERAVRLPVSSEPDSGYMPPAPRAASNIHAAESARADAPPVT